MQRHHRSKAARALAAAAGVAAASSAACGRARSVVERTVTMHVVCAPSGPPLDRNAYAVYHALGDFDPGDATLGARVFATSRGAVLSEIRADAQALFVDATENGREWWGVGPVSVRGNVDVLLLPALTSCALPEVTGDRTGAALGAFSSDAMLVVGGAVGAGLPTAVVRLDTGSVGWARPDLLTPRVGVTITPFAAGALVAGGIDARAAGPPLATAEVFDSSSGGFEQQMPILLSEARARQGAAVLGSGATLLVGGIGADGKSALASMEIVDPTTRTVRSTGVPALAVARSEPTVLRLASGEVVVAGGVDGSGAPAGAIEIFSSDVASAVAVVAEPAPGRPRAYAALQGGAALLVVALDGSAPAGSSNVWMLERDGTLHAAAAVPGSLTAPRLFGGAGGDPALWTGDRWLRWDAWAGAFAELGALDDTPAAVSEAVASTEPGIAAWLDRRASGSVAVTALRFDVRGPYSPLGDALLVSDTANTAPEWVASSSSTGPVPPAFDPAHGLSLAPSGSVFVTDRTYADLALTADLPAGPVWIVLRDGAGSEVEVGGGQCPVPFPEGKPATLTVERSGAVVTWAFRGGPSGTCARGPTAGVRVSIGVRGAPGTASGVVRNLQVLRR